jgi:hypothetical protein
VLNVGITLVAFLVAAWIGAVFSLVAGGILLVIAVFVGLFLVTRYSRLLWAFKNALNAAGL